MNGYTFEEIAAAIDGIDPGVSFVRANLPALFDKAKLDGRWCVKASFPAAYTEEDLDEILSKIDEKLDEHCLKIERDVLVGDYWLFPVVPILAMEGGRVGGFGESIKYDAEKKPGQMVQFYGQDDKS